MQDTFSTIALWQVTENQRVINGYNRECSDGVAIVLKPQYYSHGMKCHKKNVFTSRCLKLANGVNQILYKERFLSALPL